MKAIDTVVDDIRFEALDGRDRSRLMDFLTFDQADKLMRRTGGEWKDAEEARKTWDDPKPFTEEEIKKQMAKDVAFGFEKALNQRGISASLMFNVVQMWLWILEDPLYAEFAHPAMYEQYGLRLFKAVAVKYGFPNSIGEDRGDEEKYAA